MRMTTTSPVRHTPVEPMPKPPRAEGDPPRFDYRRIPGAAYATVAMVALFWWLNPNFLNSYNMVNISYQIGWLLLLSIGITLVILTEGIDLSAGGVIGLTGVVSGLMLQGDWGLWPALLIGAIGIGALCGLFTGLVVAIGQIPPFVASLGTMGIAFGIGVWITKGASVPGFPPEVRDLGRGFRPALISLAVFVLMVLILERTRFGKYVRGIGAKEQTMYRFGVRVKAWKTLVYVIAGAFYGLAAFLILAHDNAAHPQGSMGVEFIAIAAVIVGGTSFENGVGGLGRTLAGVVAVSVLRNGLNFASVPTEWQMPIIGTALILAIGVNVKLHERIMNKKELT
jgi:ribose transport system permease protein